MTYSETIRRVREQILAALSHPEAEDGLFLSNFKTLHEEDTRPAVEASDEDLMLALESLLMEGQVVSGEVQGMMLIKKKT